MINKELLCYDYSIGGLNVSVDLSRRYEDHKKIPFIFSSFINSGEFKKEDAHIAIKVGTTDSLQRDTLSSATLFTGLRFKLLKGVENGISYELLRYHDAEQKYPFLRVQVDPLYKRFRYFFEEKKRNFYSQKTHSTLESFFFAADPFLLQHSLIQHSGLIVHAAGGAIHNRGLVFAAASGTGKSTLAHLLIQNESSKLFNEERLILRRNDNLWKIWGTPWQGENSIGCNSCASLGALVFLRQAPSTTVSVLSPSTGLQRLLQVVSIPRYSKEWTNKGLAICEALIQDIPMYELAFRPDQSAVEAVEKLALSLPDPDHS